MSTSGAIKRRGRPATGKGTSLNVRLQPDQLGQVDHWIAGCPEPRPSRPEAVRLLLQRALSDKANWK